MKKKHKKNGLEIYKSRGEIRWRVYRQGRIISAATEGYKRLAGVIANIQSTYEMMDSAGTAIYEYKTK